MRRVARYVVGHLTIRPRPRTARCPMRPDAPAPSIASLVSSWLSLTAWVFAACADRANSLVEGGNDRVGDAVNDLGSEPAERKGNAELPAIDVEAFVAA